MATTDSLTLIAESLKKQVKFRNQVSIEYCNKLSIRSTLIGIVDIKLTSNYLKSLDLILYFLMFSYIVAGY